MRSLFRVTSTRTGGRGRIAAVALVASAAVIGAALTASPAEASSSAQHHKPSASSTHKLFQKLAKQDATKTYKAGQYIVRLKDDPAATYTGNVKGFSATKPAAGKQLNAHSTAVKSWVGHLASKQTSVAARYGVKPLYHYGVAYNGFAAKLTAKQAQSLAKSKDVAALIRDTKMKVQADPTPIDFSHSSLGYLKIATAGGLWDKIGGKENAGKGVVLGDIDTGIAPENPSFAGSALADATTSSDTPSIIPGTGGAASTVQFKKADGNTFSSAIIPDGNGWTSSDLSTKIIAAHYYVDGFGVANLGSTAVRGEYVSPRDGAGHGSHTASTAAGDYGVDAKVAGVDYGGISGVAPAAKIAVYKVCWDGPATDESQDGCATSDMVAAINQAVTDGVDALNFSIGGGAAQTVFSPTDEAFLNAASAGIFVSAAAGNAGPDPVTLDNAAPWETTVAASTIPGYEATVVLGDAARTSYVGSSVTVLDNTTIKNAALVDATTATNPDYTKTDSNLCGPGSLDPAVVTGKVVLCDRGVYDRVAKSAEVKAEGGIGMVLVNTPSGANDTDSDVHTVPTVHLSNTAYKKLHNYAATDDPTVSFQKDNTTGTPTPVPQIAGFSSHGPVLADGSDVLKPDVAAPGVGILAAVANGPAGGKSPDPAWDFYSGTSMATPHVTGLALDYLSVHPLASVAEIKSALMTTATNLVDESNKAVTDPFTQGAGEVNPSSYLSPGLEYLSTPSDWKNYLLGTGEVDNTYPGFETAKAIQPSNLNLASIAIGNLYGTQTVTRTVTAQQAGTYTATASVPGITTTVSPKTLKFTKVGQTAKFTVKFVRTSKAPLDQYSTGFLTWKKSGSTVTVRSPLAVNPTSISVPALINTTGTQGSVKVPVIPGANLEVGNIPLIAKSNITDPHGPSGAQYTATATTGATQQYNHPFVGANDPSGDGSGTEFAKFNIHPVPAAGSEVDLDLYLLYFAPGETIPANISATDASANAVASSATAANDETIEYQPTEDEYDNGGTFVTVVDDFTVPSGGVNYVETFANLTDDSMTDSFTTSADIFSDSGKTLKTKTGVPTSYTATWNDLDSNATYDGLVLNIDANEGNLLNDTFFTFDTTKPVVITQPTVTGSLTVGSTLTAKNAVYDSDDTTITAQWYRADSPSATPVAIPGETGLTYTTSLADLGKTISFQETGQVGHGTKTKTDSIIVGKILLGTTTTATVADSSLTTKQHGSIAVAVASTYTAQTGETLPALSGPITVKDNGKTITLTPAVTVGADGTATVTLPKLKKGTHKIVVTFGGNASYAASSAVSHTIKVK